MNICSACGKALTEGANFCQNCGALTAKGANEGKEPYWGSDLESRLRLTIINLEERLGEVANIIDEASDDINPQLERAKEHIEMILEEVGNELGELGENIKKRSSSS
jgi:hypothetical protein